MNTKYWCGLVLLVVGCSGGQTTGGGDSEGSVTDQLKKAAAEARAGSTPPSEDVCASEGWYGDGQCDTFCQDADSRDCTPDGDGFMCALFVEEANGFCSRRAYDPCISQDPDCSRLADPDDFICPAIGYVPDGVCKDDPSNPCVYLSDPDCGRGSPPGEPREPIFCAAIAQEADGVCKDDPNDQCDVYQDPDCWGSTEPSPGEPVACAAYIELEDGVCRREPTDPCLFQDPDCKQP